MYYTFTKFGFIARKCKVVRITWSFTWNIELFLYSFSNKFISTLTNSENVICTFIIQYKNKLALKLFLNWDLRVSSHYKIK